MKSKSSARTLLRIASELFADADFEALCERAFFSLDIDAPSGPNGAFRTLLKDPSIIAFVRRWFGATCPSIQYLIKLRAKVYAHPEAKRGWRHSQGNNFRDDEAAVKRMRVLWMLGLDGLDLDTAKWACANGINMSDNDVAIEMAKLSK